LDGGVGNGAGTGAGAIGGCAGWSSNRNVSSEPGWAYDESNASAAGTTATAKDITKNKNSFVIERIMNTLTDVSHQERIASEGTAKCVEMSDCRLISYLSGAEKC
jgi:hypothetical protein